VFAAYNLTIAEIEEAIDIIQFRMNAIYQTTSFMAFLSTSSPVNSATPSEETEPCDPAEVVVASRQPYEVDPTAPL
jgi:hypothetical protein